MTDTVRFNDFVKQWHAIEKDALASVERVGRSGWLILGKEVQGFESALAEYWGIQNAIGTANGMDSLEIGLRALELKPGERVLTTPLSAFATTLAIIRAGGVPVFVDVDHSGLIDLEQVEIRLQRNQDCSFLIPVHLYGHSLDLRRLRAIKEKFGLRVIEDCAQAIGAKSGGVPVGSVGEICATSFYPTKNLGCLGDGGALLTSDDQLAISARALRDYGQSTKYIHDRIGMNSRLDEIQAAILRTALLPRLSAFTERRAAIAKVYHTGIRNPALKLPNPPSGSESVHHLFPVLVSGDRESFLRHLKTHGIEAGVHYPLLITEQAALQAVNHEVFGSLEVARKFAATEVSLPIHPFLTSDDLERVVDSCNSWQSH